MKDLKISSRYDNHICTLENGEKLFSAEITLYSSDRNFLEEFYEYYYNKMNGFKPNVPTFNFPECKYKFDFTIIYVKEPSNYTTRGLMLGYYNYLVQKNGENK